MRGHVVTVKYNLQRSVGPLAVLEHRFIDSVELFKLRISQTHFLFWDGVRQKRNLQDYYPPKDLTVALRSIVTTFNTVEILSVRSLVVGVQINGELFGRCEAFRTYSCYVMADHCLSHRDRRVSRRNVIVVSRCTPCAGHPMGSRRCSPRRRPVRAARDIRGLQF